MELLECVVTEAMSLLLVVLNEDDFVALSSLSGLDRHDK